MHNPYADKRGSKFTVAKKAFYGELYQPFSVINTCWDHKLTPIVLDAASSFRKHLLIFLVHFPSWFSTPFSCPLPLFSNGFSILSDLSHFWQISTITPEKIQWGNGRINLLDLTLLQPLRQSCLIYTAGVLLSRIIRKNYNYLTTSTCCQL